MDPLIVISATLIIVSYLLGYVRGYKSCKEDVTDILNKDKR